jgi:hypothetical protein
LRAARRAAAGRHATAPWQARNEAASQQQLIALLDKEISRVKILLELDARRGSKPRDSVADMAAQLAFSLIRPLHKPTIYSDGLWHQVTGLLYEAVTGQPERDLLKYLREH